MEKGSNKKIDNKEKKNTVIQKDTGKRTAKSKNLYRDIGKKADNYQKEKKQKQVNHNTDMVCDTYKKCGGCRYQGISYKKQCSIKEKQVRELLGRFCKVHLIVPMEYPYYYRNKVHAVFDYQKGKPISGIYKEGTHIVIPIESCLLEDQKASAIIRTIRELLPSFKIKTYDEDTQYGLLRHVLIKRGFSTGEIMVVLVTASPIFPSKKNFITALRQVHPEITTIIQNINVRGTSMVLGDKEHILYGKGYIEDCLCGCIFQISSKSFYQINPVQTEKLYTKAMQLANLTGKETVIDAYCGIGTISLMAAKLSKNVIGIELNREAVKDAVINAKRNQIQNAYFYQGDAGDFMKKMAGNGQRADVVFMDPPRSGATTAFIDAVSSIYPERVIYISCNPETQARDIEYFQKKGYQAKEAWPFEQFPWTGHVEVVIMMTYCGSDKKNRG